MAGAKLTTSAGKKIATTVRRVLGASRDNRGDASRRRSYFGTQVIVKVDGANVSTPPADGQYLGNILGYATTAASGTNFVMPNGMTAIVSASGTATGHNALICNLDEAGLPGNRLKTCYAIGRIMGAGTDGRTIVFIQGGIGQDDGAGTPYTVALGAAWDRNSGSGVNAYGAQIPYTVSIEPGTTPGYSKILIGGTQTDARGMVKTASVAPLGFGSGEKIITKGLSATITWTGQEGGGTAHSLTILNGLITDGF